MSVLIVAEHLRDELRPITLELVSAAQELEGPVAVAVIAKDPSALADAVDVEGVNEILSVKVDPEEFENDVYQQALEQLIEQREPQVTFLGFTVNSMGYGPAVAAKLGLGFASDVFSIDGTAGGLVATRAFYGSKVQAEVEFPGHDRVMLLLRPTAWPPAEGAGSAVKEEGSVSSSCSRARHKEFVDVATGDVDITTADFLLSIGRGVGDKENLPQFEGLAGKMGAILSVSRPRAGNLRRCTAPRRHEDERHDHRGQLGSRGGHLQRGPLRSSGGSLRSSRGTREALLAWKRARRSRG